MALITKYPCTDIKLNLEIIYQIILCSNFTFSHTIFGFWVCFLTDCIFQNANNKSLSAFSFEYNMPQHSPQLYCMTIAAWRGKMPFEITNTWSQLITWVTLFLSRQASTLHYYTTLPIAHPQNMYYPNSNTLKSRHHAYHSWLPRRAQQSVRNALRQLKRCQVWSNTHIDYCRLTNADFDWHKMIPCVCEAYWARLRVYRHTITSSCLWLEHCFKLHANILKQTYSFWTW